MLLARSRGHLPHRHRSLPPVCFVALCALFIVLASCGSPTITPPKPPTLFVPFNLGIPAQALNAPVVGPLPGTTILHVVVTFKANQGLLNQLGKQQGKSKQGTSLKNLANQIGISDATYQKMQSFFGIEGATLKLGALHTTLAIDAKAALFASLLRIKFVIHQLNGRKFYTPTTTPILPKLLADQIIAITGLDNYTLPPQLNTIATQAISTRAANSKHAGQDCSTQVQGFDPATVAHAYGYDQLYNQGWHGENMTVNLVEIDGYNSSDVQNYFSCVSYSGNFQAQDIDTSTAPQPGLENTLDIDMVAGLAPAANIVDYQTQFDPNTDIWVQVNDELQKIISDNVNNTLSGSVVSISLGTDERSFTYGDLMAIDQSFQELTQAEHMTVFVATGDCAAYASMIDNDVSVSFPASDPWVVAVGGTELAVDANGNRSNEVVWSDGSNLHQCNHMWGSGGGVSTIFSAPPWQTGNGVNNRYANGHRQLPDVSAVAYDLLVYDNGAWTGVLGTSAATPIWAAGFVLANEGVIQTRQLFYYGPDTFYSVADNGASNQPYFDVTRGNNLYYPATPGWDDATGWGTPNLPNFYQVLSNLPG